MQGNNHSGFTPRAGGTNPNRQGNKLKLNKDGILAILFLALIAIIVIVLIVFLVKAIAKPKDPQNTDPTSTTPTTQTTPTDPTVPSGYSTVVLGYRDVYKGDLIVVGESSPYIMPSSDEATIVSLFNKLGFKTAYRLKNAHVALESEIVGYFGAMLTEMKGAFAANLSEGDFFLVKNAAVVNDPTAIIDTTNENASGLAFDLKVTLATGKERALNYSEQAWLRENCTKYGFVLRYDEGKEDKTGVDFTPYHFRYVGITHAKYMKDNNLSLEEYVELIKNATYDKPLNIGGAYVYYVKLAGQNTTAYVPTANVQSGLFSVSGDNVGGFIITAPVLYSGN
ncbi:MAG: D-alanyl-D-alanine carboxypeptidase family protein [Clostridiales bacterium]|nr:D-alanyl-D-alanine carboxypeptidase family protein [Clostridiales bacterium]